MIVSNFNVQSVGCVSSEIKFLKIILTIISKKEMNLEEGETVLFQDPSL